MRIYDRRVSTYLLSQSYRSEQHRLKEMLLSSSHDQFIEVDKFLLKHDIQDASLAVINEPLLIKETVDHDGKRYMHSVQLSGKIERYIKGRLSLAEQDARYVLV